MHLLVRDGMSLDETAPAEDLELPPADIIALSFSDADLATWVASFAGENASLQVAPLARLRHPMSVDLLVEKSVPRAKAVLVRLLGGFDYWSYGAEELARACRRRGVALAIVPGDARPDPRLSALSTVGLDHLDAIEALLDAGGPINARHALSGLLALAEGGPHAFTSPEPVPLFGTHGRSPERCEGSSALIVFYRSNLLSGDTAALDALSEALQARGLTVIAAYVPSLKHPEAALWLSGLINTSKPDVVLNATAFSGRNGDGGSPLDTADCPVLQVIMAQATAEQHQASQRGLSAADLAMHVVLPEVDGRLTAGAIAFKKPVKIAGGALDVMRHEPWTEGIEHVAGLAANWARLRRKPRAERRIALTLSTYPGRPDQIAHAVGLDGPESALRLAQACARVGMLPATSIPLAERGEGTIPLPASGAELLDRLLSERGRASWSVADYETYLAELPQAFRRAVTHAWGAPAADAACVNGAFQFRALQFGNLLIALQPERGTSEDRKAGYHDPNLPPRHSYIAFYLWLRHVAGIDALLHLGAHGTLEWLPGKAAALTPACAPQALIGPTPLIYPFIVNDPGEAAQAKRRAAAITIGHMTPPMLVNVQPQFAEIERLVDEFSSADGLDPRRRRMLAVQILDAVTTAGLTDACGLTPGMSEADSLARIDAFLCDVKELAIRDGLHILDEAEIDAVMRALDGRFILPGPSGAPSRGRADVLPTGRNLYAVDPRTVPTRTAFANGTLAAKAVLQRYLEEHGEWPRSLVIDLWGSATLRTGGEELALALSLIGVKPVWDHASSRVSGFEIVPLALLDRPRVDVTLRISGLFRDMFPDQVALFDSAVQKVAAQSEDVAFNPLRARRAPRHDRVFGAPQGAFGTGVMGRIDASDWSAQRDLGETYLSMSGTAYRADGTAHDQEFEFRQCVANADGFVHVQDHRETDLLAGGDFAAHEGGFAAAAAAAGNEDVALYHADSGDPSKPKVRTLREECARVVHGRAANPVWLEGQMRHGYRGAAEMASALDAAFAFAASAKTVQSADFERLYDAYLGDPAVRRFIENANPAALDAMRARFTEAIARGLWHPRRNDLAGMLSEAAQ